MKAKLEALSLRSIKQRNDIKFILEINVHEQMLRLRSHKYECAVDGLWLNSGSLISENEFKQLISAIDGYSSWGFETVIHELSHIKVKSSLYILYYARLILGDEDIPEYGFKSYEDLIEFIEQKCVDENVVWLIVKSDDTDVFVSENIDSIKNFILPLGGEYHLQEYSSFEEAYKVALSMAEISPLCYNVEAEHLFETDGVEFTHEQISENIRKHSRNV